MEVLKTDYSGLLKVANEAASAAKAQQLPPGLEFGDCPPDYTLSGSMCIKREERCTPGIVNCKYDRNRCYCFNQITGSIPRPVRAIKAMEPMKEGVMPPPMSKAADPMVLSADMAKGIFEQQRAKEMPQSNEVAMKMGMMPPTKFMMPPPLKFDKMGMLVKPGMMPPPMKEGTKPMVVPPIMKDCPPGFRSEGNQCIMDRRCRFNYRIGRRVCKDRQVIDRVMCPEGYSMSDGGMCAIVPPPKKEGYTTSLYSENKYSPFI